MKVLSIVINDLCHLLQATPKQGSSFSGKNVLENYNVKQQTFLIVFCRNLRSVQQFKQHLHHLSIFRLEHPVDLTVRQDLCSIKKNVLWIKEEAASSKI